MIDQKFKGQNEINWQMYFWSDWNLFLVDMIVFVMKFILMLIPGFKRNVKQAITCWQVHSL